LPDRRVAGAPSLSARLSPLAGLSRTPADRTPDAGGGPAWRAGDRARWPGPRRWGAPTLVHARTAHRRGAAQWLAEPPGSSGVRRVRAATAGSRLAHSSAGERQTARPAAGHRDGAAHHPAPVLPEPLSAQSGRALGRSGLDVDRAVA